MSGNPTTESDHTNREDRADFAVSPGNARAILIVCTLLYMINYMDRQVFAVVLEPMRIDLGLDDQQAGILQTAFLISMAAFSLPAAFLVDRWSRRKGIALMAIGWSVFTALTGLCTRFVHVLAARIGVGMGEAAFSSGGTAWIGAAYPISKRSRVMGIFNIAIPLGAALGMILGGLISKAFDDWRMPFFIFAIPGIILGIVALFLKDYKTVREVDETGAAIGFWQSAGSLFRIRTLRWMYLGFGMQNILVFAFLAWTPALLMRLHGIEEDKAGQMVGVLALMAIVGSPLGGLLGDWWQNRNPRGRLYTPALTIALAAILYAVSLHYGFQGIGYGVGILFGITLTAGIPALSAVSQDVVNPGLKGVSWAMNIVCMYLLGGGWAPWAVGAISDALGVPEGATAESLRLALLFTCVGGLLASFCFFMASRHYAEDRAFVREFTLEDEAV